MTTFTFTGQDLRSYPVEAEDEESAQKAFAEFQAHMRNGAPAQTVYPLRGPDGKSYPVASDSLQNAQKAFADYQRQTAGQDTKPESPDASKTGDALSGAWDWLKGPGLTSAVRGTGNLIDAPNNLFEPARTMLSLPMPELANTYRQAMGPTFGQKLGDAFFRGTGIPEYRATTPIGRTAMAGIEGGIPGALAGAPGVALGALSGAVGQGVREILPGYERTATVAEMLPGVAAAGRRFRNAGPELPVGKDLRAIGAAGFNEARQSPVTTDRGVMQQIASDELGKLSQTARENAGNALSVIESDINKRTGPVSFNDLMDLRDQFRTVLDETETTGNKPGNPYAYGLARAMLRRIEQHIDNLPMNPGHVVDGTPDQVLAARDTFRKANANWKAGEQSLDITGSDRPRGTGDSIMGRTENRDRNLRYGDRLSGEIVRYMENDDNTFGWSPERLEQLRLAKEGGWGRQAARGVGSALGGLKGLAWGGGAGAGVAAPTVLAGTGVGIPAAIAFGAPSAVGYAARLADRGLAKRDINQVARDIRSDSPEYQQRQQDWAASNPSVRGVPFSPDTPRPMLTGLLAPQAQPGTPTGWPTTDGKEMSWLDYFQQMHGY